MSTPTAPPETPEQTVIVIAPPPAATAPVASAAPVVEEEPEPPQPEGDDYSSREDYAEADDPLIGQLPTTPSTCGNQRGNPAMCSGLRAPGPQCESFSDTVSECNTMRTGLQPRVAEKAVQCLLQKSGKRDICQFDVANKCALAASKDACVDAFSEQPCRAAVAQCGGARHGALTLQRCQQVLSSVMPRHRRAVISCITEGCGVDYCLNVI